MSNQQPNEVAKLPLADSFLRGFACAERPRTEAELHPVYGRLAKDAAAGKLHRDLFLEKIGHRH